MKRKLLLITALIATSFAANAQLAFHVQNSGFATASRGINDFDVVDSNIVWAVAYDGSGAAATIRDFSVTKDGGATWLPGAVVGTTPTALNTYGLANISAIDADTAYASIYPTTAAFALQGVYKTINGGSTWKKVSAGTFTNASSFINFVHFFDANNGLAMGDPANNFFEIYTTQNGGVSWTRVGQPSIPFTPLTGEYGTVGYFDAFDSTLAFPTNFGRMLVTTDMGLTWSLGTTPLDSVANTAVPSISFKDKNFAVAVLSNADSLISTFMTTVDGGLTWTTGPGLDTVGGVYDYNAVEYVKGTADTYFVTSANATTGGAGAAYTEDAGATWINIDNLQHTCVQFNDMTNGWAGGFNTSATVGGVFKWGTVRLPLGVNSKKVEGFNVYPNPNNGSFYVKANVNGASSIRVMDLTGRVVFEKEYATRSLLMTSVDMTNQAKGIYFVEVKEGSAVSVQKIIVN